MRGVGEGYLAHFASTRKHQSHDLLRILFHGLPGSEQHIKRPTQQEILDWTISTLSMDGY